MQSQVGWLGANAQTLPTPSHRPWSRAEARLLGAGEGELASRAPLVGGQGLDDEPHVTAVLSTPRPAGLPLPLALSQSSA